MVGIKQSRLNNWTSLSQILGLMSLNVSYVVYSQQDQGTVGNIILIKVIYQLKLKPLNSILQKHICWGKEKRVIIFKVPQF